MIDLIFFFFRKRDKAWPNAPSLENECTIFKILDLVNFLFSLPLLFFETDDDDDFFLKNEQGMPKCPNLKINVNF